MKLSDVITPGDKIDIKMLHEANQEDNGGEIAKIYQSAVSDIFSDQELEISMPTSGGRMVLFQLERECSIVFYTKGGMYNCTAVVKKRYRKENLYLLRIVITSGLQKFQRREFFRIPYTTPLKYRNRRHRCRQRKNCLRKFKSRNILIRYVRERFRISVAVESALSLDNG